MQRGRKPSLQGLGTDLWRLSGPHPFTDKEAKDEYKRTGPPDPMTDHLAGGASVWMEIALPRLN